MTGARTVLAITVPLLAILALGAVCDANPLAFAGYIPFMAVGAAFSAELRQTLATVPWPEMLSQLAVIGATIVTSRSSGLAPRRRAAAGAWRCAVGPGGPRRARAAAG